MRKDFKAFTQELRLTIDKGPLTGVLGGYYSRFNVHLDGTSNFAFDVVNDLGLVNSLVNLFDLDVPTATFISSFYIDPVILSTVFDTPTAVETYAVFGDATYQLSPAHQYKNWLAERKLWFVCNRRKFT